MPAGSIVIRRHWWAHLLNLVMTVVIGCLAAVMILAVLTKLPGEGGWWKPPLFALGAWVMVVGFIVGLNALFVYRVELDSAGLRIVGNLYCHRLRWNEIVSIRKRHNFRVPGYHVEIQIDGSQNPARHWCNFWVKGYFIHPGMEKGGAALSSYLTRKKREYLKRADEAQVSRDAG
ncbi:hypothetical protein [Novosphingobium sp.]|uniref:hypothetical protein n=1 Tax=Novosphingobium sp. TaxID=1874826 RepID=UPI0035B48566